MSIRFTTATVTLAVTLLVGACAGSGSNPALLASPAGAPATAGPTTAAQATATATATPQATASPAEAIRPPASPLGTRAQDPSLELLWTAKGPEGTRPFVGAPTVDQAGNLWAASSYDDVFWIFDRDGKYLESWGGAGRGDGDGEFRFAADGNAYGDVAFGPDGDFYVADSGNARVQQFDPERRFVRAFGAFGSGEAEFVRPIDIDIDGAGNVYVFDDERRDVQVFDPDGAFLRTAATRVGPYEAVDDAGNVYAVDTESRTLLRFRPDGSIDLGVDLRPPVSFATGLALTPSGDLLIGSSDDKGALPEYELLIQLDPSGGLEHVWPNGAEAVAVDPAGDRVYLTYSSGNADIQAFRLPDD